MTKPVLAEAVGSALLLYVIAGSGIAAETLAGDSGVQLMAHALAVGLALGVLIAMLQTVSGAHFNPSVTLAFWQTKTVSGSEATRYVTSQVVGAAIGVVAANLSFEEAVVSISTTTRSGIGVAFAEAVATFVLVLVILALVRTHRSGAVPVAVGAWVASAVFATSSTGFANPAVTLARVLTDTYTGIAPASVPAFLAAQLIAGLAAAGLALVIFPEPITQKAASDH
jgi:glycerol uptake facilitator-like aquaporin